MAPGPGGWRPAARGAGQPGPQDGAAPPRDQAAAGAGGRHDAAGEAAPRGGRPRRHGAGVGAAQAGGTGGRQGEAARLAAAGD